MVIGWVIAFLLASPARRGWLVVGLGALLALGFVVLGWARAPKENLACHDCHFFLGRYWQWYLYVFFAGLGWCFWSLGVALGAGARWVLHARRELREQRTAA